MAAAGRAVPGPQQQVISEQSIGWISLPNHRRLRAPRHRIWRRLQKQQRMKTSVGRRLWPHVVPQGTLPPPGSLHCTSASTISWWRGTPGVPWVPARVHRAVPFPCAGGSSTPPPLPLLHSAEACGCPASLAFRAAVRGGSPYISPCRVPPHNHTFPRAGCHPSELPQAQGALQRAQGSRTHGKHRDRSSAGKKKNKPASFDFSQRYCF